SLSWRSTPASSRARATPSARRSYSVQVDRRPPCTVAGLSGCMSAMTSHTSAKFQPLSLIGAELYARRVDFELPGDGDPRRSAIREWLEQHPKRTGRELAEAGYVAPHWPKPWGLGADPVHQL